MSDSPKRYQIPGAEWYLEFHPRVIEHLDKFRQLHWGAREAGGQLYSSSLTAQCVQVVSASGPYKGDRRTRNGYCMMGSAATLDRSDHFQRGLHLCGLWHTHPESIPAPSDPDIKAIKANLALLPQWDSLLLVIQGTKKGGIYIGAYHRDEGLIDLVPEL